MMADVNIKYRGSSIATMSASGTKTLGTQGKYCDSDVVVEYTKPASAVIESNKNATPSESAQEITPSSGYDAMAKVTVGAVSSSYVGTAVPRKSSSDLTASGATVTAPAGYYASAASKSVASGTAGTPTATKGTVSNHIVAVTPSVTNTTGYITGSTKTGTAVTVSASELVSGSETKTANGTYDVTNLAELVVNVSGGGGSNWTLLASTDFTVNTTSTSNTSVGNITLNLSDYNDYQTILWVHIRDKAGKRTGYFYGSDTMFFHYNLANNSTGASSIRAVVLFNVNSTGSYSETATAYGVYAHRLYYTSSNHYVQIYSRYNSSYGTINGTFKVDVYKLTMPSGMTLFA